MMSRQQSGLTVLEVLTCVVAVVVIAAVAIPMWRTHELRDRRTDAIEALQQVQKAQDRYFAEHARYADSDLMQLQFPEGLGTARLSAGGHYQIDVKRSDDLLGYLATARVVSVADEEPDSRCTEMRLDQHGRRTAIDETGADTSADCWNRL